MLVAICVYRMPYRLYICSYMDFAIHVAAAEVYADTELLTF